MLESVGTLPEGSLKKLGFNLTNALYDLHKNSTQAHGGLTPSQILFDKSGNIKVVEFKYIFVKKYLNQ